MVLLKAGACVPSSFFKLGFSCTCGSCKCGVTNDHLNEEEQESLNAPPKQIEMDSSLTTSASTSCSSNAPLRIAGKPHVFRQASKADQLEDDQLSTASGSSTSSGSDSIPKDSVDAELPSKRDGDIVKRDVSVTEDCWYTPNITPADCKLFNHVGTNPVEAAVAAALAPVADGTPALRHRHSEAALTQQSPERESQQDWWDDAETRIVPSLEAAPSLTRLLGADVVKHLGLKRKPAPWLPGESHSTYWRLGARDETSSYVACWLNVGDASLLSVSEVLDRPALERCLANDPLGKRVKLLIRAVKCTLPFPGKGPKEADTVGAFFGKGASFTRGRTAEGTDVIVLQIDLYYLYLLRFALQNVGFRQGNVVDVILVDWPGQAVLASIRLSVTDEFLKLKG